MIVLSILPAITMVILLVASAYLSHTVDEQREEYRRKENAARVPGGSFKRMYSYDPPETTEEKWMFFVTFLIILNVLAFVPVLVNAYRIYSH